MKQAALAHKSSTSSHAQPAAASRAQTTGLRIGDANDAFELEADRMAREATEPSTIKTQWSLASLGGSARIQRKCACGGSGGAEGECEDCKEKAALHRRAAGPPDSEFAPPIVTEVLRSTGQPLDTATRSYFEPRFGYDFSRVRLHHGTQETASARAVNALAYTVGEHVVFGDGHYEPKTDEGRRLIAHELTHVVQQKRPGGNARSVLHRRRVPDSPGSDAAVPTGAGFAEARAGMARTLSRAWGELTPAKQIAVQHDMAWFGLTWTNEADLLTQLNTTTRDTLLNLAKAIRTEEPKATLGDPALIDTGARPGTGDAANITTLCAGADAVFSTIAAGTRDADIKQVFGATNVAAAKAKYAAAQTRMHQLKAADKIVTDRSGYSSEVSLGGLSNSSQIALHPSVIDNPGDKESIITLIHESTHAGNSDVRDFGYITQPSFTKLEAAVKLKNAAHFEVVPRRILGAAHDFAGQTFVPAGTGAAPALTPQEQAVRATSETFRSAWAVGLNLHKLFVRVFKAPTEWNTLDLATQFGGAPAGGHFADALPFWSKVEMLTIHTRTGSINPAGPPAVRPVTLIDVSLSEGLIRKLAQGMFGTPQSPADAQSLENASATAAEKAAAAAGVDAERDLLIRLVIKTKLGDITGGLARDERVVARMAQASTGNFSDMLASRPPSAFP